jgi:hypothetical protein
MHLRIITENTGGCAMRKKVIFTLLFLFLLSGLSSAQKCINSEGEAVINQTDIPSAKAEAIARAKWAAIEQVVGVEVRAQSVVQNMALVDDAVSKEIRGVVSGYKVLKEENRGDIFWVKAEVCVEPTKAKDALSSLALNNSIAVFIPARKPKVVSEGGASQKMPSGKKEKYAVTIKDEFEETNILSETVIGKLTEQGLKVIDVAPSDTVEAGEIEKAIRSGNYMTLRSMMFRFLSNIMLIGKVDYTVSTKRGQDIGYGIAMPFHNVTVRVNYRIITRDSSGKMVILSAGTEEGKGLATDVEDATAKGLKDAAEKLSPVVLEKVSQYIKGIAKKITVKVRDITDLNTNFEIKDALQNIAWVMNVEEKGLGEFIVSYPENTVYLANSIAQNPPFHIQKFTTYSIEASYK